MAITERQMMILKAIIDDYIATGIPVGSRTLSKREDMNISSATIRNEMADLEEGGIWSSRIPLPGACLRIRRIGSMWIRS